MDDEKAGSRADKLIAACTLIGGILMIAVAIDVLRTKESNDEGNAEPAGD